MANFLSSKVQIAVLCLSALVVVATPLTGNMYYVHVISLIAVYWIVISTLTLLVGYTGPISIGHAGLFAIGAYTYTILTGIYGWNGLAAIPAAIALGAVSGLLLGLPSLRLPGFYFALATIAFALIVGENLLAWNEITGGGSGLMVAPLPGPLANPALVYWVCVGFAALISLVCYNLARTMWGRNMIAVRDSEVAASSIGISPLKTKMLVFILAGASAGLAGALFALIQNYIVPENFHFDLSLFFFISIIIGGRGELIGPFLGTIVLAVLPEMMGSLAQYTTLIYGAILLLVILAVPRGLGPMISGLFSAKKDLSIEAEEPDTDRLAAILRNGGAS